MRALDLNLALDAVRIKAEKDEVNARLFEARESVEAAIKEFAKAAGMETVATDSGIILHW